jgi:ubiquinone biosynthesis protein
LLKYEFGFLISKFNLTKHLPLQKRLDKKGFKNEQANPVKIKTVFEELGGTFIKLGQLLSLRPDLIPKEYCDEFSKLQDNVKPFSAEEAKKIIEHELKKPLKEIFKDFDSKPLAAASIGQVHKAKLLNGHHVVVKIQRHGIIEQMKTDTDILYHVAHLAEKHYPQLNPVEIVAEFEKYTENELDYIKEAKNVDKFYKNFSHDSHIKIPKVFFEYTTSKVLVLEYIDGKKLSELKLSSKEKKWIIKEVVNSLFKQVFIDGIFHADLHPGNILIIDKKTIAFLDFGIVGRLTDEMKDKVLNLFSAIVLGKLDMICDSLLALGIAEDDVNEEELRDDLRNSLGEYYGTTMQQVNISDAYHKIIHLAKKNRLELPLNFVLLGKALITVEGFAQEYDPSFNIVNEAKPFAQKMLDRKMQPGYIFKSVLKTSDKIKDFIVKMPDQAAVLISRLKDQDANVRKIHSDLQSLSGQMNNASNRVVLGLVIMGLLVASGFLMQYSKWQIMGMSAPSFIGFSTAFIFLFFLLISMLRKR